MNLYLLDTTPLAAYLLGRTNATNLIAPWIRQRAVVTSILAYGEVVEYISGLPDFSRHHVTLRRLIRTVRPLMPTYDTLDRYADIRRSLRQPNGPGLIGDMDTLIAATALEHDLTVVTADQHFQRVPGLSILLLDRQQLRP